MRAVFGRMFGIRLLAERGVQRSALNIVLCVVLLYRVGQIAVLVSQEQWGYDLGFYLAAASDLISGRSIYSEGQLSGPYAPQGQDGFLYPPPFAAAMIPLASLVPEATSANWVWLALGVVILTVTVLALGRREGLFDAARFGGLLAGRSRWLLVGAAFALPPVVGELVLGNVHLLLLGLLGLAWLGVRRATPWGDRVAGVAIGVAAVIKVFPGILVLWFLATRRWSAAAWVVVGAVGATVLALPITGIEPWLDYPTVLANLSAPSDTRDTLAPAVWLTPLLGFTVARIIVTGLGVAVLLWAARRLDERASFSVAVVVSILVAPALYHHYLALLVLPFLLALAGRASPAALAASYLLLWGGQQGALGDLSWIVNRGLPTAGAIVLLAALLRVWAPDMAGAPHALTR